jgi:hypothetical protein
MVPLFFLALRLSLPFPLNVKNYHRCVCLVLFVPDFFSHAIYSIGFHRPISDLFVGAISGCCLARRPSVMWSDVDDLGPVYGHDLGSLRFSIVLAVALPD